MKIAELKERISNPLDRRSGIILIAKVIPISYPELRENNELLTLIKQKDPVLYEKFNSYWSHYMNYYFYIKGLIDHSKHDSLNNTEAERLEFFKREKDESFHLLIGELDKRKTSVIINK